MEDVEYITIDGIDYIITDEKMMNDVKYVYLTKEDDIATFLIKKVNIINNQECLVNLNTLEEFTSALQLFKN